MKISINYEWNEYTGVRMKELYVLRESIEAFFEDKNYGSSIGEVGIIVTALDRDWKQRKRYKKGERLFTFDILLDFFKIVNAELDSKKTIICNQILGITQATLSKYKFNDFDKDLFLTDFKDAVTQIKW